MKLRIAMWTAVGALVVAFWSLYFSAMKPSRFGAVWTLVDLTCPIALARHYALSVYFVLFTNAATYALVGAAVESMRRHFDKKQTRSISS